MSPTQNLAPINPDVLRWARESLAVPVERASSTAKVDEERYLRWESGEDRPTIAMLRKLANLYKRPLATFFLPEVPQDPPQPNDFRTIYPGEEDQFSTETRLAIRKAQWNQSVAKELLDETNTSYWKDRERITIDISPAKIAEQTRKLGINEQLDWKDNWEALRTWRAYLEDEGIFVFQYGMPMSEVRGFSLIRPNYPPVIVINSKDSVNGRIFTLFHEYGHYALNTAGICNPREIELRDDNVGKVERWCNNFSGTFLAPTPDIKAGMQNTSRQDIFDVIYSLSRDFKVSSFVVLKRLYDLEFVDYNNYQGIYRSLLQRVKKAKAKGGDYYKNKFAEKGSKFIKLVIQSESSNAITMNTALDILGVKLNHYDTIRDMLYQ